MSYINEGGGGGGNAQNQKKKKNGQFSITVSQCLMTRNDSNFTAQNFSFQNYHYSDPSTRQMFYKIR